ncbi:MAG: LamG domain-containing protein [Hyphomicrobium sp.]|jgi:hypothetical protein
MARVGAIGIMGAVGGGGVPLAITGTPVTTGTDGAAYAGFTATASGGTAPYTYTLVGTWPTGISINSSTGAVSGTPTESGSFTGLSVRVTDGAAATADLDAFSLTVAAATDPNFANVVLLLGLNGANNATSTTDDSTSAKTIVFNGTSKLKTDQLKFGTASLFTDGSASCMITVGDSADFQLATASGDKFTIEFFARFNTVKSSQTFMRKSGATSGTRAFMLTLVSSVLTFNHGTSANVAYTWSGVTTGTWYHIAIDRDASNVERLYIDGVMVASATITATMNDSADAFSIGNKTNTSDGFDGWFDEFRITKGVARYASDGGFTVPTKAFPRS